MSGSVSDIFSEALPVVYGYVRRRCGSDDLAEDLTSRAFVRATVACSRDAVVEPSIPWLITIARNALIDHWRREAVHERIRGVAEPFDHAGIRGPDPWNAVLDATRAEALLAELKPEHRAALTLRYLDDLPVIEVADALGRSLHATESLLVRARAALRRHYENTGGAR